MIVYYKGDHIPIQLKKSSRAYMIVCYKREHIPIQLRKSSRAYMSVCYKRKGAHSYTVKEV